MSGTVVALAANWAIYGAVVTGSHGLTVLATFVVILWVAGAIAFAMDD